MPASGGDKSPSMGTPWTFRSLFLLWSVRSSSSCSSCPSLLLLLLFLPPLPPQASTRGASARGARAGCRAEARVDPKAKGTPLAAS